jgi:hypothetical protein
LREVGLLKNRSIVIIRGFVKNCSTKKHFYLSRLQNRKNRYLTIFSSSWKEYNPIKLSFE